MTWNPELPDAPATAIDLNSLVSKAANGGDLDMLSRLHHRFKSSDGKSYGNMFPEVAPLIYPELDQLQLDKSAGEKLSKMKKRKEFVGEYLDKRAQAKFVSIEKLNILEYTIIAILSNLPLSDCRKSHKSIESRTQASLHLALC